ncbi:hypothetical protein X975_16906, partial [Stegodyphus mimosarum]
MEFNITTARNNRINNRILTVFDRLQNLSKTKIAFFWGGG